MIVPSNAIAKCVTVICCIVFLFAPSINVLAKNPSSTKTVMVIGTGKIYKEDSASARKQAIDDSLVSAVERVERRCAGTIAVHVDAVHLHLQG